MVSFLEGVNSRLIEFLHNPLFVLVTIIPRVPAIATTVEIPEKIKPTPINEWDDEDKDKVELAKKCRRLLIMAIPNDTFKSLDACETSKELWYEL